MDFEAIWQTHKKFILKVLGGTVIFLVLWGVRSSIADSSASMARRNASQDAAVRDKVLQLGGAEGLEKGRAESLASRLEPALLKAILWEADQKLAMPKGEKSPALFYRSAVKKAVKRVERHSSPFNAQVPKNATDMGLQEEIEAEAVEEGLARVDLVSRVILKLLDAGVRKVTLVELDDADYLPRQGDERYLRTLPVRVSFIGTTGLLAKVLAEFQVEGSFLELLTCRISREDDSPESLLVIELSFQALGVVDAAPDYALKKGKKTKRPSGRRRVRRFGRDR